MEGKQKGFTLIELLVTFAIVIILALVSVPLYEELIAGGRVKGASESLYFFILKVRSDAIKTQTTANLVFYLVFWRYHGQHLQLHRECELQFRAI
jgi:prepilin-type N-terminal cleavage/methylation domain-containing protein